MQQYVFLEAPLLGGMNSTSSGAGWHTTAWKKILEMDLSHRRETDKGSCSKIYQFPSWLSTFFQRLHAKLEAKF